MIALGHPNSPSTIWRASSASGLRAQAVPAGLSGPSRSVEVAKQRSPLGWALAGGEVAAAPCEEHAEAWGRQ